MTDDRWHTERTLFAALKGGQELIDWFGFVPSFHDATLRIVEWRSPRIALELDAFAITGRVDDQGYFELDRQATVRLDCREITGVRLSGVEPAIVGLLRVRTVGAKHVENDPDIAAIRLSCGGPQAGDYHIDIESVYGLTGAIFAKQIDISHTPAPPPPGFDVISVATVQKRNAGRFPPIAFGQPIMCAVFHWRWITHAPSRN